MKTMFGKRYPNCVKKEEVEVEGYVPLSDKKKKMITQKGNNAADVDDDGDVSDDDIAKA